MKEPIADIVEGGTRILPYPWNLIAFAIAATGVALLVHWLAFRLLQRLAYKSDSASDNLLVRRLATPTRIALIALALVLTAREIPAFDTIWEKIAGFVMPVLVGWIALAILHALVEAMKLRADVTVADNLAARRRRTRLSRSRRRICQASSSTMSRKACANANAGHNGGIREAL